MADLKKDLNNIVEELSTQRDLLALKMHLAKADVRDEWSELEKKWQHYVAKAEVVKAEVDEAAEDLGEDFQLLGDDLKQSYNRIKRLL